MPITSIQSHTTADRPENVDLEKIASSKTLTEQEKVSEMTRQFEAVLLRQILSQAQKPAFKSNLMPNAGVSDSIYQDMIVNQMAEKISSARTLGLAQQLEKQVTRQLPGAASKNQSPKSPESSVNNASPVPLTKAPRL